MNNMNYIVYRQEDEPKNKNGIWIHHKVYKDLSSPIVVQVYSLGMWQDINDIKPGNAIKGLGVKNIISLDKEEYESLVEKDPETLYFAIDYSLEEPSVSSYLGEMLVSDSIKSVTTNVEEPEYSESGPQVEVGQIVDGVLPMTFKHIQGPKGDTGDTGPKGEKGDQGDTGVVIDEETFMGTIANNLSTDAADKALSAAQGVALDGKISQLGQFENNPEWIYAITDRTRKVLCGIKPDGSIEWVKGIPKPIKDALELIKDALDSKVDTESGKSLIDVIVSEMLSVTDNEEYIDIITDAGGKVIEGIKKDGIKKINIPIETPGTIQKDINNKEWAYIITDRRGAIVLGITRNGKLCADIDEESIKKAGLIKSNGYEIVKNIERANTLKRFVPYSVGTPTDALSADNQYNRVNLLFFSDSHIDLRPDFSLDNVKDTIDFANNTLHFDAILHAGDVVTPFNAPTKSEGKSAISKFFNEAKRSKYPFIFAKGNHDLNDWNNTPANTFNDADWSELWYNYAEKHYGIVRQNKLSGEKSTWSYFDIPTKKIRIISVDTQDADKIAADSDGKVIAYGSRGFYISNEQMHWLADTALNVPEGYGVICVLHQCVSPANFWYSAYNGVDYEESSIEKFFNMCVAFNAHESFTLNDYISDVNPFYNLTGFTKDFSQLHAGMAEKPSIICWLVGHNHYDNQETRNGVNIIWILNNGADIASSDARVARVVNTPTQNAFDLISIDTKHKKIRMVRYGAGVNCYGDGGDRFIPAGLDY